VTVNPDQSGVEARDFAAWLRLREAADAAARAVDLLEPLHGWLATGGCAHIHDLGTGTGGMGRWLAPRLPGAQHWVLYDRDPDLLDLAKADMVDRSADDAPVTVETRQLDITRLAAPDLAGAALVTASALLDMLTADELDRVVAACAGAGCPTLLTISVTGRVRLSPADPLDVEITAAFNAHQRRVVEGRALLGPDAVEAAVAAFARRGVPVRVADSAWRLGPDQAELAAEWLRGWVGAAAEQRPDLAGPLSGYTRRRLAQASAGRLAVVVDHRDVLAGTPFGSATTSPAAAD
jgi:SAM-dependent methyltransferase